MIHAGRPYGEIEEDYRRRMRKSFGLACALFAVLLFSTPTAFVPRLPGRHVGLPGPDQRRATLSPESPVVDVLEQVHRAWVAAGAMQCIEVDIVEGSDMQEESLALATPSPPPDPRDGRRRPQVAIGPPRPIQPAPAVEVQLDEGFSPRSTSPPSSHSPDFAILQMIRPEYPEASLWAEVQGLVTVRALIDPNGAVMGITTLDNEADEFCELAVMAALRDWRFQPLERDGHAVWFSVVVPFRFQLTD
jgi:TonB family protein